MSLKIAVLLGTKRTGRLSEHAAKFVAEVGTSFKDVEITFVDPKSFDFPDEGEEVKDPKYTAIVDESDAFFIVTPEYNHGYPSTLKRMLDSEYNNYNKKPVAIAGVSDGPWGGVRAIEQVATVVKTLGLVVLKKDLHFPDVDKLFNDRGELLDNEFRERTKKIYKELIWMAKTLKWGRENLELEK
ncbi:NAD(P)H-dependent oxidoreductase [Candidatus Dojkabacteria bacterium]|uniref:NAD(P)H-dependent oxidoreductase n=1 Tax=Candidatus Dojkabacteria bacterium TaxID=2099670 RepID=A0A955LA68_9BACT|nr:NAD(P)H-dependent oxidoreductase [Candidatus Dojkabacteria bacterium]